MSRCDNCLRDESEVELHVSCLECLEGTSKEEQPPPAEAKGLPTLYVTLTKSNALIASQTDRELATRIADGINREKCNDALRVVAYPPPVDPEVAWKLVSDIVCECRNHEITITNATEHILEALGIASKGGR